MPNLQESDFDLITDKKQLLKSYGESKGHYRQIQALRDVSGSNFSNGQIIFKFALGSQDYWKPDHSYLRLRAKLTMGDGTSIGVRHKVAPGMNLASCLFSSAEFRIAGTAVSRIDAYMPQIDTLEKRLHNTGGWLNDNESTSGFMASDFHVRQNMVSNDGIRLADAPQGENELHSIENTTIGEVKLTAANYTQNEVLKAAQEVKIQMKDLKIFESDRQAGEFEIVFQPSLSIFKYSKMLPCCQNYELVLTPHSTSQIQTQAIQSDPARNEADDAHLVKLNVQQGTGADDIKFEVQSLYFYIYQARGPTVNNATYLVDLYNTRCQASNVPSTSLQSKSFQVSRATRALSVAYQSNLTLTDSRMCASQLVSYTTDKYASDHGTASKRNQPQPVTPGEEQKVQTFYVNYAGSQFPTPNADYKFETGADFTQERYVQTQMASQRWWDHAERFRDFQRRGTVYHQIIHKDAKDSSTQCIVSQSFQNATNVSQMNLLLFDHYRSVARIVVQNGRVVDVTLKEE